MYTNVAALGHVINIFIRTTPLYFRNKSSQQIKPKNKQIKWSAEAEVQTALAIKWTGGGPRKRRACCKRERERPIGIVTCLIFQRLLILCFFVAAKASKVIHLRNIPNESGEADVIALGIPFGRVTNVLVLKGKNQAFIEMADEISATSMVSCYTVTPPQMRGRMVYVQFSNHRELKTDQGHNVSKTLNDMNTQICNYGYLPSI